MKGSVKTCLVLGLALFLFASVAFVHPGTAYDPPGDVGSHNVLAGVDERMDDGFFSPALGIDIESRSAFYYPEDIAGFTSPLPLVVFLHGRHATCMKDSQTPPRLGWPCEATHGPGWLPLPSFQGYDYVARQLASYGYIVISISANGINANDIGLEDGGALARAQLVEHHLSLWNSYNTDASQHPQDPSTNGPVFYQKVNMQKIGLMGHSRGGEGVVVLAALTSIWQIKALLPIAPTNYNRILSNGVLVSKPALGVILSYCDGDVLDLSGIRYYDDLRYRIGSGPAAKHTFLIMGANHNYFNTNWSGGTPTPGNPTPVPGGKDDWDAMGVLGGANDPHCKPTGNGRLTQEQQRAAGQAYISSFFRAYLGGDNSLYPLLVGNQTPAPGPGAYVSYHAPDGVDMRKDVNRLTNPTNLVTNAMGGAVTAIALNPYSICGGSTSQHCLPPDNTSIYQPRQPHTSDDTALEHKPPATARPGLSQLSLGWSSTSAAYRNEIPLGQSDVSRY